jgi:ParB-like chromosome segregation protein Spo0J
MPARFLETREVALDSLERFPGNARRGNVGEIRKSIKRHGQYRSLVVRSHDGKLTVLAGNHTADALEAEGRETARCEVIECTDDEARRINLADNRLSDIAADDDAALAELLAALDGDLEGTGWDVYDIDGLADKLGDKGGDAPTDDLPSTFGVIVECDTEQQQARLLAQLDGEGFRVRALMT